MSRSQAEKKEKLREKERERKKRAAERKAKQSKESHAAAEAEVSAAAALAAAEAARYVWAQCCLMAGMCSMVWVGRLPSAVISTIKTGLRACMAPCSWHEKPCVGSPHP